MGNSAVLTPHAPIACWRSSLCPGPHPSYVAGGLEPSKGGSVLLGAGEGCGTTPTLINLYSCSNGSGFP